MHNFPQCIGVSEHEAILAGVNNQLQACSRQIDQFQSKLCEQEEALKIACDALEKISKFTRIDWLSDEDVKTEEADLAREAKQQITEILNKKGE